MSNYVHTLLTIKLEAYKCSTTKKALKILKKGKKFNNRIKLEL